MEYLSSTIVIVNRDDREIVATLRALESQSLSSADRVLVVDASHGRLDDIRRQFPQVSWSDYPGNPATRTIAHQRNVGWKESDTDLIIYLDAHCIPVDGWFGALTQPLRDGSYDVVTGPVRLSNTTAHWSYGSTEREERKDFITANVAIRRRLLEDLGGFNEDIGFAEDTDMSWRVRDHGTAILCEPAAAITHDMGGYRENVSRSHRYGRGRTRLYRYHRLPLRRFIADEKDGVVYAVAVALCWFPPAWLLLVAMWWRARTLDGWRTVAYQIAYGAGILREALWRRA
jgi:GT2 family glycosyltransferase